MDHLERPTSDQPSGDALPTWQPTTPEDAPTASAVPPTDGHPTRTRGRALGRAALAVTAVALASGGVLAAAGASGAFAHQSTAAATAPQARLATANAPATTSNGSSGGAVALSAPDVSNDPVVSAAARVSPAVVTIVSSTSSGSSTPGGQGQNPNGNGTNPFGNGTNPFGNGTNPFGNGTNPFGNGASPSQDPNAGQGTTPNGGSQAPAAQGNGSGGNGGGSGQTPYGVPSGQTPVSVGSGVIFDSNGWILTNHHVVADGGTLTVQLADGRSFPATVYGSDTLTDLAIVKINATGLPTASLGDSSALAVGEKVIAVGDPMGNYPGTVTTGVVSGIGRSISDSTGSLDDLIQTDAAINPGNSGGPLIDTNGNVVGIDTAIDPNAQGIGFAIPIDLARPLTQQALAGAQLSRPWLGIRYQPLDAGLAARNGLSVSQGAWITAGTSGTAVEAGSPAAQAGLQENDVITAVDGTKVDVNHPLVELVAQHAVGSTATLAVHRGSSDITVTVTLASRPATTGQ